MIICIPTKNENGNDSMVYGHFGSAPFFVLYDTETRLINYVINRNSNHVHGQCNPVAQIKDLKVDAVVVHGMGMNALNQLNRIGMKVYRISELIKISDIINNYNKYLVEELTTSDCCTYHGSNHHH